MAVCKNFGLFKAAVCLVLVLCVGLYVGAAGDTPDGGLVLNLPLNEGEGTDAADLSGLDNHGVITGAEWVIDALRGDRYVLRFTTGSRVVCRHSESLSLEDEITLAAWIYLDEYGPYYSRHIIHKQTSVEDSNYNWYLFGNHEGARTDAEGLLLFMARREKGWSNLAPGHKIPLGRWVHAAATYHKENGGRLYIDGKQMGGSTPAGGKLAVNEADLIIRHGEGMLSDIRIYNRVLDGREVFSLYELTK